MIGSTFWSYAIHHSSWNMRFEKRAPVSRSSLFLVTCANWVQTQHWGKGGQTGDISTLRTSEPPTCYHLAWTLQNLLSPACSCQMCHLSGWVMGSKGPFIFWAGSQCGHCEGTMTFMRSSRPQSHPHQGEVSPSRLFHSLLCWVTGPSSEGSSKTTRFKGTPLGEWEGTVQPLLRRKPLSQK